MLSVQTILLDLANFNWDCDYLCFRKSAFVAVGLRGLILHALLSKITEVSRSSLHILTTPQ
jgi:hypothetical protein